MVEILIDSPKARREAAEYVMCLKRDPLSIVTIKPYKESRSQRQNRFYWGTVLKTIGDETGHTPEELHEFFKRKFLHKEDMTVFNVTVEVYPTTTKLNTKEFTEYLDKVMLFAREDLGCYLIAMEYENETTD